VSAGGPESEPPSPSCHDLAALARRAARPSCHDAARRLGPGSRPGAECDRSDPISSELGSATKSTHPPAHGRALAAGRPGAGRTREEVLATSGRTEQFIPYPVAQASSSSD
jgi:hypothetical protein